MSITPATLSRMKSPSLTGGSTTHNGLQFTKLNKHTPVRVNATDLKADFDRGAAQLGGQKVCDQLEEWKPGTRPIHSDSQTKRSFIGRSDAS